MKLSYAQAATIACVASTNLTLALPHKLRDSSVNPRNVEDDILVIREPKSHKSLGTGSSALAEGAGALVGVTISNRFNQRDVTDDTLATREPLKSLTLGPGHSLLPGTVGTTTFNRWNLDERTLLTREPLNLVRLAKGAFHAIEHIGSGIFGQQNQQRDFDEYAIVTHEPRSRHGLGPSGSVLAEGTSALAGVAISYKLTQRKFDDNALMTRQPRRSQGLGPGGNALAEGAGTLAGVALSHKLSQREFDDDDLMTRDPLNRPGKHSLGLGTDRIIADKVAEVVGTAASSAAPYLSLRNFYEEEEALMAREPRGGHKSAIAGKVAEAVGTAASAAAPYLSLRDFDEEDFSFTREPLHFRVGTTIIPGNHPVLTRSLEDLD